jgi:hypothetical protein
LIEVKSRLKRESACLTNGRFAVERRRSAFFPTAIALCEVTSADAPDLRLRLNSSTLFFVLIPIETVDTKKAINKAIDMRLLQRRKTLLSTLASDKMRYGIIQSLV